MNLKRLFSIFGKIYRNGVGWLYLRIRQEFRRPTIRFMMDIRIGLKKINRRLKAIFLKEKDIADNYVTAIYDLQTLPVTYDFAYFLASAELFASKNKKSAFKVLFVPRKNDEFIVEKEYQSIVDEESMKWRFENIILPMMNMYPACIGYSLLLQRSDVSEAINEKILFPEFYSENFYSADFYKEVFASKNNILGFSASIQGKRYINSWKKFNKINNHIVTITLRRYKYDACRNSNVDEWVKFAKFIKEKGFAPIFIPDTDACFEHDPRLDGYIVFEAPCWNLGIRMALYEEADLNFFTCNGPATITQLNRKIDSVNMKLLVPGSLQATPELNEERGIFVGQKSYNMFDDQFQILSWVDDKFENICEEFNRFLAEKPDPK
jgi:hypothetical protein